MICKQLCSDDDVIYTYGLEVGSAVGTSDVDVNVMLGIGNSTASVLFAVVLVVLLVMLAIQYKEWRHWQHCLCRNYI
ncbi:Hypothetical predicted protein [Octopus vulgaris]|uniref:Uncharacterized protein n=1 Tax=Octopus vulgaris TaxID=6645 RepID=A0AA36EXF3_OCTVU|nr:Hypothetical predicted protein [Octopus vulgaris]